MPQGLGVQLGLGGGRSATASGSPASSFSNIRAIDLDGTADHLEISASSSLNIAGSLSISFWFKRGRGGHSAFEGLVNKNSGSGSVNYSVGFRSSGDTFANKLAFWAGGDGENLPTDTAFTNTTNWYHGVIVLDGTAWKWYINGTADGNGTDIAVTSSADDLVLGCYDASAPGYFFDGLLDEVAIFDSVLSASDAAAIYNSGTPASIASFSPVGWWRMGDDNFCLFNDR